MAAQEFVQQPEPLDQNAEPVASVEYPFVPEERETAQHESPVPDSVANPPTYTEAVRPSTFVHMAQCSIKYCTLQCVDGCVL